MKKAFLSYLLLACLALNSEGQIQFKTSEQGNFPIDLSFNEITGEILRVDQLPQNERVLLSAGEILFTGKSELINGQPQYLLKKYRLINNNASPLASLQLPDLCNVAFFSDGSFIVMDSDEGAGMTLKIYSNDFQLMNLIIPFSHGYDGIHFNISENIVAVGVNEIGGEGAGKIFAINSGGKVIFEKPLSNEGRISKVLSSNLYFALYSYSRKTRTQELIVYNRLGIELWRSQINEMIKNWVVRLRSTPTIIVGTQSGIISYSAKTGEIIFRSNFIDMYNETGTSNLRTDKLVEIIDISVLSNNRVTILTSEQVSSTLTKNNFLFLFDQNMSIDQKISLGDSERFPRILVTPNELLRYVVAKEK